MQIPHGANTKSLVKLDESHGICLSCVSVLTSRRTALNTSSTFRPRSNILRDSAAEKGLFAGPSGAVPAARYVVSLPPRGMLPAIRIAE